MLGRITALAAALAAAEAAVHLPSLHTSPTKPNLAWPLTLSGPSLAKIAPAHQHSRMR
jgi:hypothetical protein